MPSFDLFELYRFLLASLVCVYVTVRLVAFIWQWQGFGRGGQVGSALLRQYLIVLLLRIRLRRFVYELMVIGGLAAVLVLLLRMHWC
jgi:hypothetical protein